MSLNILPELPVWPSDVVGLAEIALLVAVAAVAYWLLHAVRQAERVWWEQCTRSAPSQRAPAQHRIRIAREDVACRSLPRDQGTASAAGSAAVMTCSVLGRVSQPRPCAYCEAELTVV